MARLIEARNSSIETKGEAPGPTVVVQGELGEEGAITPELYQLPGVFGRPPDGSRGVYLPMRHGRGYGVIVAMANYRLVISPDPEKGETVLYSTNAEGDTVQATIRLDDAGNIDLNGNAKKLVTFAELDSALQAFKTSIDTAIASAITGHTHAGVTTGPGTSGPGAGAASPTSVDISAAETTTVRTGG